MEENSSTPEAAANGRCNEPCASENKNRFEAATPAGAGGEEEITSCVDAGEGAASTGSTAGATADAEATQAAEEAVGGEATATRRPAASNRSSTTTAANGQPYYYAHAGLPRAAEDSTKFAKVMEAPGVVTGGPPILLGRSTAGGVGNGAAAASDAELLSASEAAAAAVAGKRLTGFTVLQSYMWTDDGARVRRETDHAPSVFLEDKLIGNSYGRIQTVYVQLDKLPETPEEKAADPCFGAEASAATFEEESAALVIYRKAKKYLLNLNKLYFPVKPSESRMHIKNDKIILRLVKEDENLTWFSLMKSK